MDQDFMFGLFVGFLLGYTFASVQNSTQNINQIMREYELQRARIGMNNIQVIRDREGRITKIVEG